MTIAECTESLLNDQEKAFALTSIPILFIWVLGLTTISGLDRLAPDSMGALDWIATIKVAVRLVALMMLSALLLRQRRQIQLRPAIRLLLPWFIFFLWAGFSVLWSSMRSVSVGQVASLAVLLLLSACVALTSPREKMVARLLLHLTLMLTCYSVLVLLAYVASPIASGMVRGSGRGVFHPTNVASTAMLGILLSLGCRLLWGWPWTHRLIWIGLPINMIALLLAHNRLSVVVGGLLAIGMCGLLMKRSVFWSFVLGVCVFGFTYMIIDPSFNLVSSYITGTTTYLERGQGQAELTALSGRAEMWEVMWKSWQDAPLIGHGYFVTSAEGSVLVWGAVRNHTAHNIFLQVLVTTGFVGCLIFVIVLIRMAPLFGKQHAASPVRRSLLFLAVVLAIWYGLWSTLNESFLGPLQPESIAFFTLLGLLVAQSVNQQLVNNLIEPSATTIVPPSMPSQQLTRRVT